MNWFDDAERENLRLEMERITNESEKKDLEERERASRVDFFHQVTENVRIQIEIVVANARSNGLVVWGPFEGMCSEPNIGNYLYRQEMYTYGEMGYGYLHYSYNQWWQVSLNDFLIDTIALGLSNDIPVVSLLNLTPTSGVHPIPVDDLEASLREKLRRMLEAKQIPTMKKKGFLSNLFG